jgi:sporulation protein YlmC with PRC-barrel domain
MAETQKRFLKSMAVLGFAAAIFVGAGNVAAQTADSGSIGVSDDEMKAVTLGWSAKKKILGKPVYNDDNQKIGLIDDLIITPGRLVPYVIIGVGGFLGIGKHDVAIPMSQLKEVRDRLVVPTATRFAIRALPKFQYAR